jgi:alpha-ketoglutarate-dependent 2,4-dichlorophenoxyacetate dioxygenase
MPIDVSSLSPGFAVRVEGLDAADPADADIAALKAVLAQHPVVVLPRQTLSPDAQVAFAQHFGPLDSNAGAQRSYNTGLRTDLLSVSNADNDAPAEVMDRRRMLDLGNKLWHSDSSFKAVPAHLSMLYALKVPETGGDTQFADLRAGYDALTPEMMHLVEGLVAEHSMMHSRMMLGFNDFHPDQAADIAARVAHDIVRTLPETGRRTLYLSAHASHIVGLPIPIGRMLLHELTEIATAPDRVYSHRWTTGDLVIWDNRCTLHRLRRYRASDEVRTLRRVTTLAPEFPARDADTVVVADWVLQQAA